MSELLFYGCLGFAGLLGVLAYLFSEGGLRFLLALVLGTVIFEIPFAVAMFRFPALIAYLLLFVPPMALCITPFGSMLYRFRNRDFIHILEPALGLITIVAIPILFYNVLRITDLLYYSFKYSEDKLLFIKDKEFLFFVAVLAVALIIGLFFAWRYRSFLLISAVMLSVIVIVYLAVHFAEHSVFLLFALPHLALFCGVLYVVRIVLFKIRVCRRWRILKRIGLYFSLFGICVSALIIMGIFSETILDVGLFSVLVLIPPFLVFIYFFRKGQIQDWWVGKGGFTWLTILSFSLLTVETILPIILIYS